MQAKKPQKNPNTKNKSVIVDQQNEPFLRTIFKRVRNINKKLAEIADLKKRDDLKPEQVEKLNRKAEYEQQRTKLQNIADFFRQVYVQNQQHYKNNQLQELDQLAQGIAAIRTNLQVKQGENLNDLKRVLTGPSTQSLSENVKDTTEVLRRFASDFKLKKTLTTLIEESQKKNSEEKTNQPEKIEHISIPAVTKVVEPKIEVQAIKEEPAPVVQKPVVVIPAEPQVKSVQQEKVVDSQPSQLAQKGQKAVEESRKPREDRPYKPRNNNNRNYQPRADGQPRQGGQQRQGGERKRYQNNDEKRYQNNDEKRQRPNYKQKNQESDSDSSLEKDANLRNFRKEEIKKLENDGFTVVGKPKPQPNHHKKWHENKKPNTQPRVETAN